MYKQIITTENDKIEIKKYLKDVGFLGLGLLFGDYKLRITIVFDFQLKKMTIKEENQKASEILFKDIASFWVHKAQFMEGDNLDYRTGVFLNNCDFESLYVFYEPHFGRDVFQKIEKEMIGENEPFKIRTFQELKKRISDKK